MALHTIARRAPAAALAGLLFLTAAAPARPQTSPEPPHQDDATPDAVEFADLTFNDARSRAERLERLLVVLWVDGTDGAAQAEKLRAGIFDDPAVIRWMDRYAVAARVDGRADSKGAQGNKVKAYPAVDLLDLRRGGRIERFVRGSSSTDFLASVLGLEQEGETIERPSGDEGNEPFRWLAWANGRFRLTDPRAADDALDGYRWCLNAADEFRPGFRARYLEFLLQRVAYLKQRSVAAPSYMTAERTRLERKMTQGTATRRDVYELTRVDYWRRRELDTRDTYIRLGKLGEDKRKYREWLFFEVVPELSQWRQYGEILDVMGEDAVAPFKTRVDALARQTRRQNATDDEDATAEAAPVEESRWHAPMEYVVPDDRGRIIVDASWAFEALLSAGRGADARALLEYLGEQYPLGKTYGLFMERALRLEMWSLAVEIADLGMAVVDERGQKRLQRLLTKIPVQDDDETGGR